MVELDKERGSDCIDQVAKDFIWAAGISPKSKVATVQLMALDGGDRSQPTKADLLVNLGGV